MRSRMWVPGATPVSLFSLSILVFVALVPVLHAQSFEALGDLGGDVFDSRADGVSADGTVVVGRSMLSTGPLGRTKAFRWSAETGMVNLGAFPGDYSSFAYAASADGSVVVGWGHARVHPTLTAVMGFRWTASGGMQEIGSLSDTFPSDIDSKAFAVSADGNVIVGESQTDTGISGSEQEAFRWTSGGMQPLGTLGGSPYQSQALGVSADGSVVVGYSQSPAGREAFRWTQADGMQGLGDLPGGDFYSIARAVSADGTVIVGSSLDEVGERAFRWTADGGMQQIGNILPLAVSADGSVIVGQGAFGAYVWTETEGWRTIKGILENAGLDLGDWYLSSARGISADGTVVVGGGRNPNNDSEAWRAVLPPAEVEDIIVTTTGDESNETASQAADICDVDLDQSGRQCTLRAAIELAHARDGATITFNIPESDDGCGGDCVIEPTSPLPSIRKQVEINASTQPAKKIRIDGSSTEEASGLVIEADGVVIESLTIGNFQLYGIEIHGGSGHEITKSEIGVIGDGRLNEKGGILVDGGATDVTIGGLEKEDENEIGGGIQINDVSTQGIRVLRNKIEIPTARSFVHPLSAPIDFNDDGPTCAAWSGSSGSLPNGGVPAPRVFELGRQSVSGFTRPGATVVAYAVVEEGTIANRYWARKVEATGVGEADSDGRFTIDFDSELGLGQTIALSTVDSGGNTSELSQLRRPVIFLPGVGGSWLEAENGDNLWLPGPLIADYAINDRIRRMSLDETGSHSPFGETVNVDGVIEELPIAGFNLPYRPVLVHIQEAGYLGNQTNSQEHALDLWRFPYDWRLDPSVIAVQLGELVDKLTANTESNAIAASCQVDILTHSNGGMVASAYIWQDQERHRNKVNRLIMSAAPYLGAPQVVAAHTRGYLFDFEASIPRTDLNWGILTTTFLNLPNGYGLLPSRAYLPLAGALSTDWYLVDLAGRRLHSYDETFDFMTRPKQRLTTNPEPGLRRNGAMWTRLQNNLHDMMNDWRTYDGPPQVFRHVGRLGSMTAVAWYLPEDFDGIPTEGQLHLETGDGDLQVAYRESLTPLVGWGDGTVPLLSATLGGGKTPDGLSIGREDWSGQDREWIEPFEYFPCKHVDTVSDNCTSTDGVNALDRVVDILKSSYQVVEGSAGKGAAAANAMDAGEALYIDASGAVRVIVEDESGAQTGPLDEDSPNRMTYDVKDIGYWPRTRGGVVAFHTSAAYAVTVTAEAADTKVRVTRGTLTGEQNRNVIYEAQTLGAGGTLRFEFASGGTPSGAPVDVDADGDEFFERQVSPAAEMMSSQPGPSIPWPEPRYIQEDVALGETNPEVALDIPGVGGPIWQWSIEHAPDWWQSETSAGQNPDVIAASLSASSLLPGIYRDTVRVTLTYGDFTTTSSVPVTLAVRDEAAVVSEIVVQPQDGTVARGDSLQFWVLAKDQLGLTIDVEPTWTATGGTIDATGMYHAGQSFGLFSVTATNPDGTVTGSTDVEIVSGVAVEETAELPTEVTLEQNYPNPFNPVTVIPFSIPKRTAVRISVFNTLGQEIAVLVDRDLAPGRHIATFDAGHRSSGVYFVRMLTPGLITTRKMVLLK